MVQSRIRAQHPPTHSPSAHRRRPPAMSRFTLALLTLVVVAFAASASPAADNELTPEEKQQGWKLLFNGKDLTGWICNTGEPIATPVEDGALVPYKSGGYIIMNKEQFGDFVLKCDVKMDGDDCNSGIFFRVA